MKPTIPPPTDRAAWLIEELETWNGSIPEQNRREKYCKMVVSPFIFYRGTNHLFWADVSEDERLRTFGSETTRTWLQGDLHAANLGAYTNDEEEVIYSINDFDEFVFADYQFDLWRMAASLILIARENGGFSGKKQKKIVRKFAKSYLKAMKGFQGTDKDAKTYYTAKNTSNPLRKFLKKEEKKNSRKEMLADWTIMDRDNRKFNLELEKLAAVSEEERTEILEAMMGYGETLSGAISYDEDHFRVKDIARRLLAGTGSLGASRYYLLLEGETDSPDDDRILDVKAQYLPTGYSYVDDATAAKYDDYFDHDAHAHAAAYRALTRHTDDYLGWINLSEGYFSVRERSYVKEAFPAEELTKTKDFMSMAKQWGKVLATAHARADRDFDEAFIPYSLEEEITNATTDRWKAFCKLVGNVASEYANVVESDWKIFLARVAPKNCEEQ